METAASRPDPASLTPAASGEAAGTGATAEPSPAQLRAALADTDRRLRLLIDQFAEAHRLRLRALDQAAAARARVAKQNAQLQQQQLVVQEARLHAEKAEKLHAAAEEARARATTENERLILELATTRERLADALQQVVSLDARLATAEARVDQLQGTAKEVLGQPSHVIIEPSVAENAASPSSPGSAADNPPPAAADTHHAHPTQAVTPAVYLVRADDNLSLISAKVYGDAGAWRRIYDANRDVLQTPDALVPGMTLVIP
jgi:nucleoid-associated protein YgaU